MLAIRLPQSIEERLEKLARRTGRTKTYYVGEAILDDLEEMYLAEGALERIRSGEERTVLLKDVVKRHGIRRIVSSSASRLQSKKNRSVQWDRTAQSAEDRPLRLGEGEGDEGVGQGLFGDFGVATGGDDHELLAGGGAICHGSGVTAGGELRFP
jgi:RHH-type transcriptional regulator, rel operon repressor / antitoxin RelB